MLRLFGVCWLLLHCTAVPAQTALSLNWGDGMVNLSATTVPLQLPLDTPLDPDALWQQVQAASSQPADTDKPQPAQWLLQPGQRTVAAWTLLPEPGNRRYVIESALLRVDQIDLFWREPGRPWASARSGDKVALSQWPFVSQFPAFSIAVDRQPVQLVVALANDGQLQLPLRIMPDPLYQQRRLLQANLSGLMLGVGITVFLICALTTLPPRRREIQWLAAYSAVAFLTMLCINGYAAIWLTPEWPVFNDVSKHFFASLLAALLCAVTLSSLDPRHLQDWQRHLPAAAMVAGLAVALAQLWYWPNAWREISIYSWFLISAGASLTACLQAKLMGARYLLWSVGGVVAFMAAVLLNLLPRDWGQSADVFSAAAATLFAASALLFRQGLVMQHENGRDVLGRDQLKRDRDPLTALLSFEGFRYRFDEHLLRQQATGDSGWMAIIELRNLKAAMADYGLVITERLIVRMAAILQREMGGKWLIGRIDDQRFAVLSTVSQPGDASRMQFTALLTSALRQQEPAGWVEKADLRIACVNRQFKSTDLQAMLDALSQVTAQIRDQRRIVML